MQPEDAFDTVHLAAAREVDEFAATLATSGKMDPAEARMHADNAYLFVEYLSNTYPKMPQEATERDAWVFLFDYYMMHGPFAGEATRLAPRSLGLFFEFLARRHRVREIEPIRATCAMEALYLQRLAAHERIAAAGAKPGADLDALGAEVDAWWHELDSAMRRRGLVPDSSLAGGPDLWGAEMGPLEAAVYDAVCLVLAKRARDLARDEPSPEELERQLLAAQRSFMKQVNPGLGRTPLEAVLEEREAMQHWRQSHGG